MPAPAATGLDTRTRRIGPGETLSAMTQDLLPLLPVFPARHLEWLASANAAEYPAKKYTFYPLKSRLLRRFAMPDGFDLQTIVLKCWCGDGIFRGVDGELPRHCWSYCHKCNGTGVYMRRKIVLARWLVGGRIFHEPMPDLEHRIPSMDFRERIAGRITHAAAPSAEAGRRAMLRLMLRYEPARWWRFQCDTLKQKFARRVRIPLINAANHIRRRFGRVDDIPF